MTTFHAFAKPSIVMKIRLNAWSQALGWMLLALCCWCAARADEAQTAPPKSALERFLEQDYLLGNWGGLRSKLSANGVDFEFGYFRSLASNVGGGIKQGSVLEGALLMALELHSE